MPRDKPARKEPETDRFGFTQPMVPLVDYVAMMENIRKQVLAEVMGEIKGEPAGKASVEDEDIRWADMLFDDAAEDEDLAELQELEFDGEEPDVDFDEDALERGFYEEVPDDGFDDDEDDDDIEIVIDIEPEEDEDEAEEDGTDTDDDGGDDDDDFDFSGLFELGEDDEEEEAAAGDEDFDIMELMRSVVEDETDDKKAEKANRMEDISELVAPGEVADVTLEELGEVVAILRKQKKKR